MAPRASLKQFGACIASGILLCRRVSPSFRVVAFDFRTVAARRIKL
jgi:hypothetical protein